jgi:hypothetical protein
MLCQVKRMREEYKASTQRVEFRVICRYADDLQLTWKTTDTFHDAIRYINSLEPQLRNPRDWHVYEVTITETAKIAHTVKKLAT